MGKFQQRPSSVLPVALPVELPVPVPTALPMAHEPMLLVAVTQFMANSAAFTYFTAGAMRRNITSDMVGTAPAVGQSCPCRDPTRVPLCLPTPCAPSTLCTQHPDPSATFQLPRRFPLQLRTKSLGVFAPQVGAGGMGQREDVGWDAGDRGHRMGHR